ncbi:hypothetical protein ACFLTW_03840 [Chloroflexota bacterium]
MGRRTILNATLAALVMLLCVSACAPQPDFRANISKITRPYVFNAVAWEAEQAAIAVHRWWSGYEMDGADTQAVQAYFTNVDAIKELQAASPPNGVDVARDAVAQLLAENMDLADRVESVLEHQLSEVLREQGIYGVFPSQENTGQPLFPPVDFKLAEPPHLLVISPRQHIGTIREVILAQELSVDDVEAIEEKADGLGVSSLVVPLGGLAATYPAFVTGDADLDFVLATMAEEWVHQYLVFRPLGFQYVLDLTGISPNYEIATINETVASMAGDELARILEDTFYPNLAESSTDTSAAGGFNYYGEMRNIRRNVDTMLAAGHVMEAETYMAEKRDYLESEGYYIRKLNQAYFAFYGAYADSPGSISPIGAELAVLREESGSLAEFLQVVSEITSRADLARLVGGSYEQPSDSMHGEQ